MWPLYVISRFSWGGKSLTTSRLAIGKFLLGTNTLAVFWPLRASLTSLISLAALKGGFSCSSCSLSSCMSRCGRSGEPARAWQKMEFTGEDLNLRVTRQATSQCSNKSRNNPEYSSHLANSTGISGVNRAAGSTPPPHIRRWWPRQQTGSRAWPLGGRRTARTSCEAGCVSARTEFRFPSPGQKKG